MSAAPLGSQAADFEKKREREKKALALRKEERTIDFTASSLSSTHPFLSALSVAHKLISTCPTY